VTEWSALLPLQDILIVYYFGSPIAFYTSQIILLFIALIMAGLEIRLALIMSLPLVGTYLIYGLFGSYDWVANVLLLIIGIVYAYAVIELMT